MGHQSVDPLIPVYRISHPVPVQSRQRLNILPNGSHTMTWTSSVQYDTDLLCTKCHGPPLYNMPWTPLYNITWTSSVQYAMNLLCTIRHGPPLYI
ncbi:unnamed protein product [Staurois parvus]|uniref:Uncharacterized protein n=1 Tax=Staurois parvus TaxID=386267 RepID=A0ABN9GI24_9NEOB|nr:unnamed protein product [Staurois parvus]